MIGTDILCLVLGLAVGFGTGWICYRGRQIAKRQQAEEDARALKSSLNAMQIELARISERDRILEENHQALQNEIAQERQFNVSLHAELSRERTSRNHLEKRIDHQKGDLQDLEHRLTAEFKTLVEQVLQEKSQTLTDINQSSLNFLLQPIQDKLQDFKQKIEEQHFRETRELIVLHNKLANLEAGRGNHSNGNGINGSSPAAAVKREHFEADAQEYTEYSPDSPETMEAEAETAHQIGTISRQNLPVECGGSHTFTPKQQVEIDNFFKRTVGRSTRKKPGEDSEDTDSED